MSLHEKTILDTWWDWLAWNTRPKEREQKIIKLCKSIFDNNIKETQDQLAEIVLALGPTAYVNWIKNDANFLIHYASSIEMVTWLIKAGADINAIARIPHYLDIPIHYLPMVSFLFQFSKKYPDEIERREPLREFFRALRRETLFMIDLKDEIGRTALFLCYLGPCALDFFLDECGANMNILTYENTYFTRDPIRHSLIYEYVCKKRDLDTIENLLKRKAIVIPFDSTLEKRILRHPDSEKLFTLFEKHGYSFPAPVSTNQISKETR